MSGTLLGIDTRIAFTALVAVVALQRLVEVRIAARNLKRLKALGGYEVGAGHYPVMVAMHSAFLVSCVAEVWVLGRPWNPDLAVAAMAILAAAVLIRWWTLRTLGSRWTTRVIVVPGERLVSDGPYRWLRHPNYLAVVLEIAAIPLVHGAWLTALVFTLANLVLLRHRVGVEASALAAEASRSREAA